MYQTEFTEEQYRQYETPNICAVCHKPCVMYTDMRQQRYFDASVARYRVKIEEVLEPAKYCVGVSNLKDGKKSPIIVKLCKRHADMLLTKPKSIKKAFSSKNKSQLAAQERAGQLRLPFMEVINE